MLVVTGLIAFLVTTTADRRVVCLSTNDYETLTGVKPSADTTISPGSFYTNTISFDTNSSTPTPPSKSDQGSALLEKIAQFYKTLSTKSIQITVSGTYYTEGDKNLTNERITAIASSLQKAGVDQNAIQSAEASYTEPEDTVPTDSSVVTISVSSATSCQEEVEATTLYE